MLKKNIKFILGIIFGIIISGSIAYAVNVASSSVSYTRIGSSVTSVESALNELYPLANKPKAFDNEIVFTTANDFASNKLTTDYNTLDINIFLTRNGGQKGVCIILNNDLHCFYSNNYIIESKHVKQVFNSGTCTEEDDSISCLISNFHCSVQSSGKVSCYNDVNWHCHTIDSNGNVTCGG